MRNNMNQFLQPASHPPSCASIRHFPTFDTRLEPSPEPSPGALSPGPRRNDFAADLPLAKPTCIASAFCFMR